MTIGERIAKCRKEKNLSQKHLRQLCIDANINYNKAKSYKRLHPELTIEQIIIHYRPDCYINIQGELIIPNKR